MYLFELKYSCAAFKSSSAEESDELFFSNEVEEISCEDATSLPEEISLKVCVEGFSFSHGLGHGIGINVHEAPPSLNQSDIAKMPFEDGMCYTIEPGLYNPDYFGVRLENSCYRKENKRH